MLKHPTILRLRRFLREELWLVDMKSLPKLKRYGLYLVKVAYIVAKSFVRDKCALHASALTFITLLSTVPVLALSMAIAEMMGFGDKFVSNIREVISNVPEQVRAYIDDLLVQVQSTEFLALGIVGIVLLVWFYVRAMHKIEFVLNEIWGVQDRRRWHHKVSMYIGLMVLVTFTFVVSTSVNATIRNQASATGVEQHISETLYQIGIQQLSMLGVVFGLVALYMFVPFTKVNFKAAITGAVFAGFAWFWWQKLCLAFQIGINSYGLIYGALASIPITLYWMYFNWLIVLLGAEISFAFQNLKTYSLEYESHEVSQALRRRLAFRVVYDISKRFKYGNHWKRDEFQSRSKVPIRLLNEILQILRKKKIIAELADGESWVPAKDLNELNMRDIEMALRGAVNGKFEHIGRMPGIVADILKEHEERYFNDLANRSFADLLETREDLGQTKMKVF